MVSAMNCKYYPRLLLHMLTKETLKCNRVELKYECQYNEEFWLVFQYLY